MTDISDFDAPKPPAWFGAAIPLLIVLLAAGFYWFITTDKNDSGNEDTLNKEIRLSGKLSPGQTYYIFASEIEVYPTNLENEAWDQGKKGPDIRYSILWNGNAVFESITKDDSLIADWSGLSIELNWKDLLGKSVSSDDAIKAGRIRFEEGEKIEIAVEDVDVAADDDVGRYEIEMEKLSIGKNEFKLKKTAANAIRKITLRVLPVGSNIEDLANIMK
ncbi:MAG: hypothetical protein HN548_08055 [Opitutae bacterium]|jgi:hypothetical protein|nr:hypothetical protein [Opitutae bacterium]MBT5716173.1 hypothetical protein [Opitutae bacterium]